MVIFNTGNASRNNVPNKTLLVGTFVCAVLETMRSTFCVPNTVLDVHLVLILISLLNPSLEPTLYSATIESKSASARSSCFRSAECRRST